MKDAKWLYHLTITNIAEKIKHYGMTSAKTRIGRAVANPQGSFAQNRKKMEQEKSKTRLVNYLAEFLARGCPIEKLKLTSGKYTPFAFTTTGKNQDFIELSRIETEALKQYALKFPKIKEKAAWRDIKKFKGKEEVKEMAEFLLRSNKNHSLARLAVQYTAFSYKIEETITASHLYFLMPKYAKDGYTDYIKHLRSSEIVILRVKKVKVMGLKQDDSDFRALMTEITVPPDLLEIMEDHTDFHDEDYRSDAKNWKKLTDWG